MTHRPTPGDLGLLLLAVIAISSSAVLTRWAAAPALALAFWRTAGGALALGPGAIRSGYRPDRRRGVLLVGAGLALAIHFAAWLESIERTSVASSVTLVAVAPLFVTLWRFKAAGSGPEPDLADRPTRQTWLALALTIVGAVVLTGGGALDEPGRLDGDGLAIVGAIAMAVYLLIGERLRTELPTAVYAAPTYAVAAIGLLAAALVSGTQLTGFDQKTWLAIGLMTLGPQLGGHTVLNLLLYRLGSITVSLALLAEPIGASVLAWLALGEAPPAAAWLGTPLVLLGLGLQITSRADQSSS